MSDEKREKYQLWDQWLIQYQILWTNIKRIVWQTVRRITNEILRVKGLIDNDANAWKYLSYTTVKFTPGKPGELTQ